jgi:hypothetical protein
MSQREDAPRDVASPIDNRRRRVVGAVASAIAAAAGIGTLSSLRDQPSGDTDGDGIPDSLERSTRFHRQLEAVFEEEIKPLDPNRRDLLVDVRYIGGTSISGEAKAYLQELFYENGISLQWLDYPVKYDLNATRDRYGIDVEDLLVSPNGFYWNQIEPFLWNVAFQLIVLPGRGSDSDEGQIYCRLYDDHVNGMNFGNRATVAQREEPSDEAELILHEVAHLVLCHDSDPNNPGAMGRKTEVDLTAREWEEFRSGLNNVHDTTGVDVTFRRCLLKDYSDGSAER